MVRKYRISKSLTKIGYLPLVEGEVVVLEEVEVVAEVLSAEETEGSLSALIPSR